MTTRPPIFSTYRYLEPKYADLFINDGLIRVGSAQSFAALEDDQQDSLDGAVRHNFSMVVNSRNDPSLKALEATGFLAVRGSGELRNCVIENCGIVTRAHGHTLCLSMTPLSDAFRAGGKTAVVEITDTYMFSRCLSRSGTGVLSPQCLADEVSYEPRIFLNATSFTQPNPFVKDVRFAAEDEFRIFWPSPTPCSAIDLQSLEARRFMRRLA